MSPSAAPGILSVEGIIAFVLALGMLFSYGNLRKQNPLVTGTTLLIWFLSFFIVFLLPIDVTSVGIHQLMTLYNAVPFNNSHFTTTALRTCNAMTRTRRTVVRIMGAQALRHRIRSAVTIVTNRFHLSVSHR